MHPKLSGSVRDQVRRRGALRSRRDGVAPLSCATWVAKPSTPRLGKHSVEGTADLGHLPGRVAVIIFLDFGASSLLPGSWPVEIGWSGDGADTESHLLKPAPSWVDWSPASQAVHGISVEHLREHGRPVDLVANRVVDVLASPGNMVSSDAPAWEQLWLDCLLREAGLQVNIKVHPAVRVYQAQLRRLLELAPPPEKRWHDHVVRALEIEAREILEDTYAAELQRSRTRHRAGPDSEGMLWILLEIRARVDARLAPMRNA